MGRYSVKAEGKASVYTLGGQSITTAQDNESENDVRITVEWHQLIQGSWHGLCINMTVGQADNRIFFW